MFKASQNAAACLRCQFCTPLSPKALTTCLLSRVFDLRQNRYHSTTPPSQPGEKHPKLYPVLGVKKSRYQRHVARLDVQTLGEVGEVVILKERASRPNQMTARKFSRILEKETDGDAPWDNPSELLKEVDKSRLQLGDAKEVIENINKIRGNHEPGDKLDRNEWRKLRTILENGFTANQLTDYHKQFEPPLSSSDQNDGLTGLHSGWRPGTSLFLEMDPEAQKQTASRIGSLGNMAGKIALAEMVLRDCWQLSVSGEIGQLDIHLAPHEIFMLLLPDISPLKDLAITYAAKIDVSRSLNLVRITANESACELVRQGVVGFFPRIMSRTVDLPTRGFVFHGKNRRFEERFFRSMQKSLNVFCCKDQGTKQIKIYFVSEMEKEADEAYRNIKAAISMTEEDQTRFCTYFPDTESAVLYSVSYQEFLPWADRQRGWLRWMKPLSEAKTPSGTQSEPPPALIRKSRGSAFEKFYNPSRFCHEYLQSCVLPPGPSSLTQCGKR
ncbi:respiratory complex assembly protein Rmp1 [Histoplasma capsulatum]|uniref:Respiratory complex assembly protein Rmp1 n=1 Tax=Ajellomyces capsulatus TaxID=5037 RepID=A0A8A1MFF9_AJECA|nr:respiratory complex assembly protein Rmp1 [Histoplasma capsulatum]